MEFNSWWFLGLGFLSVLLLTYVQVKTRSLRSFLLFLSMVGAGYMIETVIYNLFHSYQYYPKFIHYDTFYDSNMGAIASNALALPVAATFIAVFKKNWKWIIFFISLFAFIEWLFLKLGIYEHNWWKIYYTSLGLPFYFLFAKGFYQLLLSPLKGKLHTFALYLLISPISGTIQFLPIMFFSNRYYEIGLYKNPSEDTTAFGAIYYLGVSLFLVWIAKHQTIHNWLKYIIVGLFTIAVTYILKKAGILYIQAWWDPWYYVLLSIIMMFLTLTISKQLTTGPRKMPDPK